MGVAPRSAAADAEALEELGRIQTIEERFRVAGRRIDVMLNDARRERDIIHVTCLNDKLTQVHANLRTLEQRHADWLRARLDQRPADAEHELTVIEVLGDKVLQLQEEADQCLGQELFMTAETRVEMVLDDGGSRGAQRRPRAPPPPPSAPPLPDEEESADEGSAAATTIVYRAALTLGVFEVEATQQAIIEAVEDLGGHVQEQRRVELTVRVPAARFREAISRIEERGDVLDRHIASDDVGEEYRDLSIRLQNAEAMRDRLAAVLSAAREVEEILAVERELERVTLEIERLRGRIRFLDDRIAMSTITVAFRGAPREGEVADRLFRLPFPWLEDLGLGALLDLADTGAAPADGSDYADPSYDPTYADGIDAGESW